MSKLVPARVLGATLAAMNLAGTIAAVAQTHTNNEDTPSQRELADTSTA